MEKDARAEAHADTRRDAKRTLSISASCEVVTRVACDVVTGKDTTAISPRSTVLPRAEVDGREEPVLLRDERRRYEQVERLGEGGIGEVLKVRDNDIDRLVAVKRLRPGMRGSDMVVRFVNEIRTVGALEHPNIVPIHDVGLDEQGEPYFVMKYVGGETLESIIAKLAAGDPEYHRRFPFERRVDVFIGVLEAIRYAHARGTIHRDLKPANIMVGLYGEVVVMDWGLAKRTGVIEPSPRGAPAADPGSTAAGTILGTPAYMSPEQARGEPADARSDIYSLSVVCHELLTLRHYLAGKRSVAEVLSGVLTVPVPMATFVKTGGLQPPTPVDLSWFLRRGLEKRPEDRYQSVDEMLERLKLRRDGFIPVQCPVTFLKRVGGAWMRLLDRHPVAVTSCVAALFLGTLALAIRAVL